MPCVFMASLVESAVSEYGDVLTWKKVSTKEPDGAKRFFEFSKTLGRLAPVPCIIIQGELVFDSIPGVEELKAYINKVIISCQQSEAVSVPLMTGS